MLNARSRILMACVFLVLGLTACTNSFEVPPAPTRPIVTPPARTEPPTSVLADATIFGMVYEVVSDSPRQIAGIEGVSVYCEACGESTHNFAQTDSKGEYVFPRGVWTRGHPELPVWILVQKDGYQDPTGLAPPPPPVPSSPGWRGVVINGDTRFDIELARRP